MNMELGALGGVASGIKMGTNTIVQGLNSSSNIWARVVEYSIKAAEVGAGLGQAIVNREMSKIDEVRGLETPWDRMTYLGENMKKSAAKGDIVTHNMLYDVGGAIVGKVAGDVTSWGVGKVQWSNQIDGNKIARITGEVTNEVSDYGFRRLLNGSIEGT